MANFNKNFYQPKTEYTREMAEARLVEKGLKGFRFTGCSYSNGASFYFEGVNGEKIRVSDHRLTGRRALGVIQVDLVEQAAMTGNRAVFEKRLAESEARMAEFDAWLKAKIASENNKNKIM